MLREALLPDPLVGIVVLVTNLLILAILVRVILSYFPGTMHSTAGRILAQVTDPVIDPIRRVVPPIGMIDLSPAIAILLLYVIRILVETANPILAVSVVVKGLLFLVIILLLIRILFGVFRMSPWNPFVQLVVQSSEPFAQPFRRWFPRRVGTFDWAPVAAMALLVAAWILVSWLGNRL